MNNNHLFNALKQAKELQATIMEMIKLQEIDWQHLAENDLRIEAIINYRDKYKCSLKEAKAAIDWFVSNKK